MGIRQQAHHFTGAQRTGGRAVFCGPADGCAKVSTEEPKFENQISLISCLSENVGYLKFGQESCSTDQASNWQG